MKNLLKKLQSSTKAAMDISGIVVDVVLVLALIPIIKSFIANAENMTATETALLVLVTLFIILGLVFMIGRQTGLIRHRK